MNSHFISVSPLYLQGRALLISVLTLALGLNLTSGQIRKAATQSELTTGGGNTVKILDKRMSPTELEVFLHKRTSGHFMGSFQSYGSLLWAVNSVAIWCESTNALAVKLRSPYPENYRPTWKEVMDVLGRQVDCNWSYKHDTGYWMFEEKRVPPAFKLKIADGWTRRDSGESTVFVPPVAPVGMDVYYMGHYSSDDPAKLPELYTNARKHVSKLFAERFKEDVSEKDFSSEKVCGVEATFFSVPTPRDPKLKWRQWAFVKNGTCFVVVSVISDENEARLLKDVKGMLSTFEVAE